jgi:hypothetical protein
VAKDICSLRFIGLIVQKFSCPSTALASLAPLRMTEEDRAAKSDLPENCLRHPDGVFCSGDVDALS